MANLAITNELTSPFLFKDILESVSPYSTSQAFYFLTLLSNNEWFFNFILKNTYTYFRILCYISMNWNFNKSKLLLKANVHICHSCDLRNSESTNRHHKLQSWNFQIIQVEFHLPFHLVNFLLSETSLNLKTIENNIV
jgi:hypothetical protein